MSDLLQEFFVEPVSWQFDEAALRGVRTEVFIEEQQVPEADEWDDMDAAAQHFLATTLDHTPIGTARLTRDGHIGRMAVVAPWRGRGVGDALLRAAVEFAQGLGLSEVRLMAQTHAIGFYERHGFVACGDVFDDAGIPHRWMRRALSRQEAALDRPPRGVPDAPEKARSNFSDRSALAQHLGQLIDATQYELALFSRHLEPRILDTPTLVQALRALAAPGAPARIRILVVNSRLAVQASHPVIDLAQRLPSVIQIRRPGKDHIDYPSAFAIADEQHLMFRQFADQYDGYIALSHRPDARRLLEFFDDAWEQAHPDPEFRRLAL